ncbi:tyrosine-type recombinase/integrase [Saccharothrix australiensis]|uniref:Site-specific recombinase XerD n=1 Tax=Saccharothrix australiensis TaxID=2072 RepID=A0A495W2Q5_9PSEU|nr:tyrosine-type recombinase/integrase [Saccharothrix australiensis]RKT55025.1 site-specific recombinase XerD [Saccharothrix australiensis]
MEWLLGYRSAATRLSYADALGLDRAWVRALTSGPPAADAGASRTRPAPPTRPGRHRDLAWLRWCGARGVHPLRATSAHVKLWQHDLAEAGVAKNTRGHRLAAVGSFYAHLAEQGVVAVDPTRFNRRGLSLGTADDTARGVVLTADQVARLLAAAASPRRGRSPLLTHRATAVVALFTLGLRVGELTGLRREDLHTTRGRRALHVRGKGDKARVVFLSGLAGRALDDYLAARDRHDATATPARPGTVSARRSPLIATRDGGPLDPRDVWALLRRVARASGPLLAEFADRVGPHVLRHFYVTTAAEGGADMTHVQADVGHASVDTTNRVYNQAARHPDRSAVDVVERTLLRARDAVTAAHATAVDALRAGVEGEDPVEVLHGLRLLHDALDDGTPLDPPLFREALRIVDALLDRPAGHPRIALLAASVRARLG